VNGGVVIDVSAFGNEQLRDGGVIVGDGFAERSAAGFDLRALARRSSQMAL
jgi:hypothetical protein